jgi:hypothetical protein
MKLLGDALTKTLATVAALLTALGGLPYVRCVCPDGRVKLFCPGPSRVGCCCVSPETAAVAAAGSAARCSEAGTTKQSPSADGVEEIPQTSCGDRAYVRKTCGCKRTLVTDVSLSVAEEVDGAERLGHEDSVWSALSAITDRGVFARRVPLRLLPPPDLVVRFCHFTC